MKFYLSVLLLIFVISCSKENNRSTTSSNKMFPDAVGNHWVYKYNDGFNSNEHIYVDIAGSTTLPNGQTAAIWTSTLYDNTNQKFLLDSSYVVADDQKVIFYAPPCIPCMPSTIDEKERYIFPLRVDNFWFTDVISGDTTKVLSEGSLTVPAGTFDNTFQLSRTIGYVTNSYTKDTIWLTPKIGMTKYNQNHFSLGPLPGNGIWELESYTLK